MKGAKSMKKPDVSKLLKKGQIFFVKHEPGILTGIGIGGMFIAIGFAVSATPKALELLKISPKDALYVGDHFNDVKAANAAFCDSAAVLWGYGTNECIDVNLWNATYCVKDVNELKKLIFC